MKFLLNQGNDLERQIIDMKPFEIFVSVKIFNKWIYWVAFIVDFLRRLSNILLDFKLINV